MPHFPRIDPLRLLLITNQMKVLQLKVIRLSEYSYIYQVIESGRIIVQRPYYDGTFVAGIVLKDYIHPWPYTLKPICKTIISAVESKEANMNPYGIALLPGLEDEYKKAKPEPHFI